MARTSKNRLKDIIDQIVTQLRTIDGTTYFNFELDDNQVEYEYKDIDQCPKFPHIYISAVSEPTTLVECRDTQSISDNVELFGYVKNDKQALTEALKLHSDIEQALYSDVSLNSLVTSMQISSLIASGNGFGVVHFNIIVQSQFNFS